MVNNPTGPPVYFKKIPAFAGIFFCKQVSGVAVKLVNRS